MQKLLLHQQLIDHHLDMQLNQFWIYNKFRWVNYSRKNVLHCHFWKPHTSLSFEILLVTLSRKICFLSLVWDDLWQKFIFFFWFIHLQHFKTGMTALKSLLHDNQTGKSQASNIIHSIFFCFDTQVCAHPFQAYAHTHIQCDQNLDFVGIWGFIETSLFLICSQH